MVPDISLRIQTMLRSMTDMIIPSIPQDNALSKEQAYLVVAHLRLIADQIDRSTQFQLAELRDLIALNQALGTVSDGGDAVKAGARKAQASVEKARALADIRLPSGPEIDAIIQDLRSGADDLVKAAYADGSPEFRDAIGTLVTGHAKRQLTRERILTRTTGFDAKADKLPDADTMLETATR